MSEEKKTRWVKIKNQNLAVHTRHAGFDLAMYSDYSTDTKIELKRQAVSWALDELADEYEEKTQNALSEVKRGVYVIKLSDPFTIEYANGKTSNVVYIGRGAVLGRLKSHYFNSLFDFMQSLSGTNFDFWIAEPKRRGRGLSEKLYKQLEHDLLQNFSDTIGGGDREFPLLNKNSGTNYNIKCDPGWNRPFDQRGLKPKWVLKPTKHWKFSKLSH